MMSSILVRHFDEYWPDNDKDYFTWALGPIMDVLPEFRVCRIKPSKPQEPWTYATVAVSRIELGKEYGLEFVFLAPDDNARHIETLAMVAHYHATIQNKLDLGRIVNCGRAWLGPSPCDHLLLSLPYPFGPAFEWCRMEFEGKIRFLWLVPITTSEAAFAVSSGVDALERRLEENRINAVDPMRRAVV